MRAHASTSSWTQATSAEPTLDTGQRQVKTFLCGRCGQGVFFENWSCTGCCCELSFLPDRGALCSVQVEPNGLLRVDGETDGPFYRHCKNRSDYGACNWAVSIDRSASSVQPTPYCWACRRNLVVPNLTRADNLLRWGRIEAAKRRLLYTLHYQLALSPIEDTSLAFRFLADEPGPDGRIVTGFHAGCMTLNIEEADPSQREKTRSLLGEAYRTLLGHFRHESGHHYWGQLVNDTKRLAAFRQLFGDERTDYGQALARHYHGLAPAACPEGFVSAYATVHPSEDWAETWTHYLHMVDTLESAGEYGVTVFPKAEKMRGGRLLATDQLDLNDFDSLIAHWTGVALTLNALSRSMGTDDPYPFAPSEGALQKLRFVHELVHAARDHVAASRASAPQAGAHGSPVQGDRSAWRNDDR